MKNWTICKLLSVKYVVWFDWVFFYNVFARFFYKLFLRMTRIIWLDNSTTSKSHYINYCIFHQTVLLLVVLQRKRAENKPKLYSYANSNVGVSEGIIYYYLWFCVECDWVSFPWFLLSSVVFHCGELDLYNCTHQINRTFVLHYIRLHCIC